MKKVNLKGALACLIALLVFSTMLSGCSSAIKTPDPLPHLISASERENEPIRPIDSFEEIAIKKVDSTAKADIDRQLNELLACVSLKRKPDLKNASLVVSKTYEKAVAILNNIILNDMTDYEKIHAIHDYLTYYTKYDRALYEQYMTDSDLVDIYSESFDIRGPLLEGKAVCEGLSEAFVLLAGIEGIHAVIVTGEAGMEIAINHAWNRVYLDEKWYNVDCTFDIFNITIESGGAKEERNFLSHAYFLVDTASMIYHSESSIMDGFYENGILSYEDIEDVAFNNYNALEYYGYFEKTAFATIDGKEFTFSLKDQADVNTAFKHIRKAKNIGKIEFRMPFIASGQFEIAMNAAYAQVINSSYSSSGAFKLINGVVFCLIYK